jgi:hypothetical protein
MYTPPAGDDILFPFAITGGYDAPTGDAVDFYVPAITIATILPYVEYTAAVGVAAAASQVVTISTDISGLYLTPIVAGVIASAVPTATISASVYATASVDSPLNLTAVALSTIPTYGVVAVEITPEAAISGRTILPNSSTVAASIASSVAAVAAHGVSVMVAATIQPMFAYTAVRGIISSVAVDLRCSVSVSAAMGNSVTVNCSGMMIPDVRGSTPSHTANVNFMMPVIPYVVGATTIIQNRPCR